MAKISTSTQEMRAKVGDIRDYAGQYNTLSTDLFTEGRELDTLWEGDASDSFANRLKNDEPRFAELHQIMNQYCDAIDESANDYDKTESAVAEEMRSNQVRQSS